MGRQSEFDRCAGVLVAFDADLAVVGFDDFPGDGQAEAGPVGTALAGDAKELFENAMHVLAGDARPELLSQNRVTLQQVFQALQNNNSNTGGNVLRNGEQGLLVRGVNALSSVADIEKVSVASYNGRPIFVRDVADVRTGMAPQQGKVAFYREDADGKVMEVDDVVEGIVVNRKGTDATKVVEGIKAKVKESTPRCCRRVSRSCRPTSAPNWRTRRSTRSCTT